MRPNRSPLSLLPLRRSLRIALAASLPLMALSACDHADSRPTTTFAPPQFSSQPPLHLNVASISIVDRGQPGMVPGDLSARAPFPPDQSLRQMAHDRLIASGSGGQGVLTIDRASILHQPGGLLDGQLNVHLDVTSADGRSTGYAVAQVTRTYDPKTKSGNTDTPENLNALTDMMLQDMSVELENQIRNNLGNWLVTPPVPGSVAAQPLDGAETAAPAAPVSGAVAPYSNSVTLGGGPTDSSTPSSATTTTTQTTAKPVPRGDDGPDAIFPAGYPSDDTGSTTQTTKGSQLRSPPPGTLTLPGSTTSGTAN
ncbi:MULTISPECIES: hypothetical protein [Komagataeibacter]|uniref:Lipoprotein n=1 Tax=Komagataeibacter saccharivorans TaxID=265959 RepID=A0A347WBW7_9PROT|nr:hypothetical protein [Komagataeibacter saccharivorans]AXY22360.1 hypothetical protein CD178_01587 [Komagataeibacter saccharivorans]